MEDCKCPYCGAGVEIEKLGNYADGETYEQECPKCEKKFVFSAEINIEVTAHKADCLNDGNHIWEPFICFPKSCSQMICKSCDSLRDPTQEECQKYGIPSKEEYFKIIQKNRGE